MMRKCWESEPRDRPTFRKIYSNISQYIAQLADYLHLAIGSNPFSEGRGGGGGGGGEGGGGGRGESRRCDEIEEEKVGDA